MKPDRKVAVHLRTERKEGLSRRVKVRNGGKKMIPQDPVMLLGFLNLKLRDFYGSLDALCEDLELDRDEILQKMKQINYTYDEENNRFV